MTHLNTPQDHYKFLQDKLNMKLTNLDASKVRGEYKVAVFNRYLVPSLRYHLTVHNIHTTHLDQLDLSAQKYLKQWLGIPSRGCTSLGIFSPSLLATKPVSQVYLEGHVAAYVNSSLVADPDTKEALRCAVEREGRWKNKSSTVMHCHTIMEEMGREEDCFIPTPDNCATFQATIRVERPKILKAAKAKVVDIYKQKAHEGASKVPFQGELLSLMAQEEMDMAWRSLIYRVPRGVMAWAVRACTQTLATPDNLQRWGVRVDPKCAIDGCGTPCTLGHLLSCCTLSLTDMIAAWRI